MRSVMLLLTSGSSSHDKIPTGLIVGASNGSTHLNLSQAIAARLQRETRTIVINLASTQASNLKSALRHINRSATNHDADSIDDETIERSQQVFGSHKPIFEGSYEVLGHSSFELRSRNPL